MGERRKSVRRRTLKGGRICFDSGSSSIDFIAEECTVDSKARCLLTDFYERYCDWARQAGIAMTQQRKSIKRNLDHLRYIVKHGKRGVTVHGLSLNGQNDIE